MVGWLAATPRLETLVLQTSVSVMESHDATDTSVEIMATMKRIRQSMPDSEALDPVSGKSHSKEVLRASSLDAYLIARVKYTAPPISQPITPTENVGCSSRPAS